MPPILYLDANVYDHMVKGYIPQAEVNGLRAALRAGRLTARLSSADLVEILGHWETNRSAALARLRIARDLVGFQGLLKDPTEILREAVEAYAAGSQAAPVTLPEADRRYVVDHLVDVAAGSLRESPLMSEIIDDMRTRKKRLHTRMTEAKALAEKHLGDAVDMRELRKLWFLRYQDVLYAYSRRACPTVSLTATTSSDSLGHRALGAASVRVWPITSW